MSQSQSGHFGEEKNLLHLGIQTLDGPARSLVTMSKLHQASTEDEGLHQMGGQLHLLHKIRNMQTNWIK